MKREWFMWAVVVAALIGIPALADAQPVITSVVPSYVSAGTGTGIDIYGTGFGTPSDVVTFQGGNTAAPCFFGCWGGGHLFVIVPATWSGPITVTSGGLTSAGFNLGISFSWSGTKWFGGRLPFSWFLNQNGAPGCTVDQTRDALIAGYNAWQCASGVTMNYGGTTAVATTAQDGVNCRYWSNSGWSPGTIAVTNWWYFTNTGEIFEADIAFNSQHYTWSCSGAGGSMDVENIGTHEEGHSIGLLDMYGAADAAKTMYGYGSNGETQKQTLDPADVDGAEFMYPHAGRPDFTAGTPGGWYWTVVPRNTADANTGFAPLPPTLNGNTTSYLNAAMTNAGGDCAAPYGLNHLWVDDEQYFWMSWGGVWSAGLTYGPWLNLGAFIRGGRHALKETMNDNFDIVESNYGNNTFQTQYVWSPYLLADQVPIYRGAPPQTGPFFAPNCDGYQFTGNWWGCVGIMPTTPGDDYDLQLFNDYGNSTTGFATPLKTSDAGGTNTDFVLINGNNVGVGFGATRWAGVIRYSVLGGGGYVDVQQSNAVGGATLYPGTVYNTYVTSGTITMGAYDIVKVHEVYLGSTSTAYTFHLVNLSGTADLNIGLFAAGGDYYSRFDAIASSQTIGPGTDEAFNYQPPGVGFYGVVVWKRNSADLGLANDYELRVGPALSNLNATVTPGGFSSPAVPRDLNNSAYGNAVLTPTLEGNTNNTYFNWATQQEGPNLMPGWDSYLIMDEGDYPYSWYFTVGDGNGPGSYQTLNNGPNVFRGGRHSLTARPNLFSGVAEATLADNVWRGQWVWSPLLTTANVPNVRATPPFHNFTYYAQPNSDGLQFNRTPGYAWVVSEVAQSFGDDFDMFVYDDYAGSSSGFSNYRGGSFQGLNYTDYVVGHYNLTPTTVYPAIYRFANPGAGGSCASDQSDALGRNAGENADFLNQVMSANRLTDVYEANLLANKTYYFTLRRRAGSSDIAFEVFPGASGGIYGRGGGTASSVMDPDFDLLTYTTGPTDAGWHPIVVYRDNGIGSNTGVTYDLRWSTVGYVSVPGGEDTPTELAFAPVAPNPMMESAKLHFDLPAPGRVSLQLFDVNGRLVRSLVDESLDAGRHTVVWDGRDANGSAVGAGLYWARFQAAGKAFSRRITVLR